MLKTMRPDLPVIICTGHGVMNNADQKRAERLGIKRVLNKPMRLQDMALIIREVLDSLIR